MKFTETIYYTPYEYGSNVITLSPEKANEMFEKDLAEMVRFYEAYGLDADKALLATESIWKKHIVNR